MNFQPTEKQILDDLTRVGIFATHAVPFGDGSSQSIYKIKTNTGNLTLKLFTLSNYKRVQYEITLLYKIAKYHKFTILPIHKKPIMVCGGPAYIYKFFEGKIYSDVLIKKKYYKFGVIIAELDIALQRLPLGPIIISNSDLLNLPPQTYPNKTLNQLVVNATKLFTKEVLTTNFNLIHKQYIHKDLHFFNIIYNVMKEKYLIIDTSGISINFLPREISVSVGNILLDSHGNISKNNVINLLRGYDSIMKLNKIEKRAIPLFIIQKKLGEIEYLHKQLQLANFTKQGTEIIKKYTSLSVRTLNYVVKEYDSLVNFFSEIS